MFKKMFLLNLSYIEGPKRNLQMKKYCYHYVINKLTGMQVVGMLVYGDVSLSAGNLKLPPTATELKTLLVTKYKRP